MIDPTAVSTIRVGELSPEPFSLTDNIPHEVGTELKRGTIEDLATFISAFIGSADGVGFRAISVTDGQTLPTTTQQEFILVGKGTYYNVVGGSTIICTEELNAIVSNGSYWFIGVEIPVNVELAGITQFIRDGFINTTPSEDAIYDALALKANVADSEYVTNKVSTISTYSTTLYPNEKATHDALDLKLNISDLPTNLTLYPTNVASDVSGYVKMVTDIHAPDYNTVAVDVSTPAITGTGQLVSQRIADAGVLIGQPGVFNVTTFGNIRRLSGSGTATFYFEVYHRDVAGVETLICTSSIINAVVNGTYQEFTASGIWNDGEFSATDRIVIKSYANRIVGGSDPIYQFQFGGTTPVRTLLPVPFSVVDAGYELKANKQNDLTIDGTGTKYPTVDAVNNALPTTYSKVVYVNATSPTTATIFDTENPPVTNDNLLKNDTANLYIGTDASTWVYLTGTGYVTKIVPSTSNFNTFGTTVDAGNSKTSHVTRSGAVTLTGPLNILNLKIATTPTTSAGSYDILTRNSSTTALEKVSSTSVGNWTLSSTNISNNNTGNVLIGATDLEGNYSRLAIKGKSGTDNILAWVNNAGVLKGRVDFEGTIHANQINSTGLNTTGNLYFSTVGNGLTGNNSGTTLFVTRNTYWESNRKIDYSADLSSTYTSRSLVDKAYTDAKITQTITNGVTDKSPSGDAVFDALANVSRNIILDAVPSTAVTGTISETILKSYLITANTFSSSTLIKIPSFLISKTGTVGTAIIKIYFNSTNTLSGATQIATYTITGVNTYVSINRTYILTAGTIKGFGFTTGSLTDVTTAGNGFSSATFDTTSDKYIITSCTLSNSADSVSQFSLNIVN